MNRKGFTLIELAIVIVIAALLAAVAIPIYQGIIRDSKLSEAETKIGTIKVAIDTYIARNAGTASAGVWTDIKVDQTDGQYFVHALYDFDIQADSSATITLNTVGAAAADCSGIDDINWTATRDGVTGEWTYDWK